MYGPLRQSGQLPETGTLRRLFSATLLPVQYYRDQLAGREDDYAIYAPSPFSSSNRLLMIARDVSTKYTRRTPAEYQRISDYILRFIQAKTGNYLIFFPSYRMLEDIRSYIESSSYCQECVNVYVQETSMSETEREEFLSHLRTHRQKPPSVCV